MNIFKNNKIMQTFIIIAMICFSMTAVAWAETDPAKEAGPVKEWAAVYGGKYNDGSRSINPAADGGYIIAGYSNTTENETTEVYLVKIDGEGKAVWSKNYGHGSYASGVEAIQTKDGGYIVAGYSLDSKTNEMDALIIKTDSGGNLEWNKTYGRELYDDAYSIVQMKDGRYAFTGSTDSFGNQSDVYFVVIDESGNIIMETHFGGPEWDDGNSLILTDDGGLALVGYTESYSPKGSMYLIKFDSNLTTEWSKSISADENIEAYNIIQTEDGGYLLTGSVIHADDKFDRYVAKLDAAGETQWKRPYGSEDYSDGSSAVQLRDAGYVLVGPTGNNSTVYWSYIQRLDRNGDEKWLYTVQEGVSTAIFDIKPSNGGGYVVAGYVTGSDEGFGGRDIIVIKYMIEDTTKTTQGTEKPVGTPAAPRTSDGGEGKSGGFCSGTSLILPLVLGSTLIAGGLLKRRHV